MPVDYTPITKFGEKDTLSLSDSNKIIYGAEWDDEFADIADSLNVYKYDSDNLASQAEAEAGALNTVLVTPLRTSQAIDALITASGAHRVHEESELVVANSTVGNASTTDYLEHDDLTLRMTQSKWYEFELFIDGSGSGTSTSLTVGVTFSSEPALLAVVPYAAGGLTQTNLILPSITTDTTGDWAFQIDANSTPSGSAFSYGPIRGVMRASTSANTRIRVKWRSAGLSTGVAWINAGSWMRIRKLN